jgi:hypothetical protein
MTAKKSAIVKTKTKKATAKKATAKKAPVPKASAKKAAAAAPKPKPKAKNAAAAKPKPKATKAAAAKPKPKPKKAAAAAPKKKAAAAPKTKATAAASKSKSRPKKKVASTRASDRARAVVAQLPQERALTDEEREAMAKCAQTALAALDVDGVPSVIVSRIGGYVDEVRAGHRPEPSSQDIRLGLGVLWGEQVRAQVGWRWVHLSYPNGFASYALVPDDRAFACFPLNRLTDLMRSGADAMNTSVPLFDSIRIGALPARRENAYLVIG